MANYLAQGHKITYRSNANALGEAIVSSDVIQAFVKSPLTESGGMIGLIDIQESKRQIVEPAVRGVQIHLGYVIPLCWPVDGMVVLSIELLDADNKKEQRKSLD